MPNLERLILWRPNGFSWTSRMIRFWKKRVGQTIVSIFLVEHTNSFEEDLCQLVKQLVRFNFLDIHGHSCTSKIEFYRAMVKRQFPHSIFLLINSDFVYQFNLSIN